MKLLKSILNKTYRPVLEFYLRKDRPYTYDGIYIMVKKGVFHPAFFFSTKFLIEELKRLPVKGKTLLELGCGSGLISVIAGKMGALVIASDINKNAVANAKENAFKNDVSINTIQSDLFDSIPIQVFDYVIINPPYYRGKALSDEALAWYAGENMEYFEKLFSQIGNYISTQSVVLISLSEDCEIDVIRNLAFRYNFKLVEERKHVNWIEVNYIYRLQH